MVIIKCWKENVDNELAYTYKFLNEENTTQYVKERMRELAI